MGVLGAYELAARADAPPSAPPPRFDSSAAAAAYICAPGPHGAALRAALPGLQRARVQLYCPVRRALPLLDAALPVALPACANDGRPFTIG